MKRQLPSGAMGAAVERLSSRQKESGRRNARVFSFLREHAKPDLCPVFSMTIFPTMKTVFTVATMLKWPAFGYKRY
ncbi:MAG: hypothetical protein AB7F09_10430 [Parvibaculaceae bacterium]